MSKYFKKLQDLEEFEKDNARLKRMGKTRKAKEKRLSKDERLDREYNR